MERKISLEKAEKRIRRFKKVESLKSFFLTSDLSEEELRGILIKMKINNLYPLSNNKKVRLEDLDLTEEQKRGISVISDNSIRKGAILKVQYQRSIGVKLKFRDQFDIKKVNTGNVKVNINYGNTKRIKQELQDLTEGQILDKTKGELVDRIIEIVKGSYNEHQIEDYENLLKYNSKTKAIYITFYITHNNRHATTVKYYNFGKLVSEDFIKENKDCFLANDLPYSVSGKKGKEIKECFNIKIENLLGVLKKTSNN